MTFVRRIDVLTARLPFRFSFGHALAERRSTENAYVRLELDDGTVGFGEGVPREYVTGETVETAVAALRERLAPVLLGRELNGADDVLAAAEELGRGVDSDAVPKPLAARCALELALLDAGGRRLGRAVSEWLGPRRVDVLRYDAIIPFSGPRKLAALALAARVLGMRQAKIKVGVDLEHDLAALRVARRVLGRRVDLRVDANCAWSADEALEAIARMRPYRVSAVEQPLPADDLEGLRRVTEATTELIVVDESLRSVDDAVALIEAGACDAFNIRVSKCGGLLDSMRIARLAADAGLVCIVGAQVGESGILSAAGRHLAAAIAPRYLEGSAGRLLLKEDLTVENVLPGLRGRARPYDGPGLGVRVREEVLHRFGRVEATLEAAGPRVPA